MVPLHGRRSELQRLDAATLAAAGGDPQLTVVLGPRRVGKTFLLQHHLRAVTDAKTCYRAATRLAPHDEIAVTWQALTDAIAPLRDALPPQRWSELFDAVVDASADEPIVFVLDEAPYLIDGSPSFAAELQRSWDRARHLGRPARLHLVLTGSALATISKLVSSQGALFERPNQMIRLDPFDLPTSATFLGTADGRATVEAYAATGGYPLLLGRWNIDEPATENLIRLAGDPVGALATNASTMLLDLPTEEPHMRVMTAVGRGATKYTEIANHAGVRIDRHRSTLEQAGYLRPVRPIGDRRTPPHYELTDQYLRFWFAMVERDVQLIEAGQGAAVIRAAMPRWNTLLGDTFERQAREHLIRLVARGDLPDDMIVGRWWTHRPRQIEIDAVGLRRNSWALMAEAKWNDRFTRTDFNQLLRSRDALHQAAACDLALYAREAFADDVVAATDRSLRFTADDLIR